MIRRLILALIIVFLKQYKSFQIQIALLLSTYMIFYFGYFQPQKRANLDKIDIFNEFCFLFLVHSFIFLEFSENYLIYEVGWFHISLFLLNLCFNFLFISFGILEEARKKYCPKKKLKKKVRKYHHVPSC